MPGFYKTSGAYNKAPDEHWEWYDEPDYFDELIELESLAELACDVASPDDYLIQLPSGEWI